MTGQRSPAHGFADDEETRRLLPSRPPPQALAWAGARLGGPGVAERFTGLWEQAAGAAHHPWGNVVTIVGFLDDLRGDWGSERLLVEDMLARAVTSLGG